MRRSLGGAALLAVVALVGAACGRDATPGSKPAAQAPAPASADEPAEVDIPCEPEATQIKLVALESETGQPPSYDKECISVPAGEDFRVKLRNDDFLEHNVSVFADGDELLFRGDRFRGPGEAMVYEVPAIDEPGQYEFVCDVHLTLMRGTLLVK